MRRISVLLGLILAGALSAAGGGAAATAQEGGTQRPNVVFILADDMRADDFEHMPQTRRLLADQGTTFSNAFVTYSLCCPSRASILRGQYAHNHQVIEDDPGHTGFERFQEQGHESSTVATWLKDGGYRTVLLGKYINGYDESGDVRYVPPGWDEWYAQIGGDYYRYRLNVNGRLVSYGGARQDYYTDVLARQAKDYVRRAADDASPFFMYLAPKAPHTPLVPAPRHKNAHAGVKAPRPFSFDEADVDDKPAWVRGLPRLSPAGIKEIDNAYRGRLRMLLSLDEMVAGLIGELQATGELDNTYVVFTSDNGYHLGEHRISLTKRTPYEEAHRVPLVVRGPGVPAGRTVGEMALNTDFAPTFAQLAGVPAPPFVDGRSLAPLLGGAPPATWRTAFLLENWRERIVDRAASTYDGVRTGTHKYVEHATGEEELYDLSSDPHELRSLHGSADPALAARLRSRIEALRICAGQSCRDAEDAP